MKIPVNTQPMNTAGSGRREEGAAASSPYAAGATGFPTNRQRFLLFNVLYAGCFFVILSDLVRSSWASEYYSYIPYIPFISAYLLLAGRERVFGQDRVSRGAGWGIVGAGCALLVLVFLVGTSLDPNDRLAGLAFSIIVIWIGGFALSYGMKAVRAARFPLLFLFFTIPLPTAAREAAIRFLQQGSTEISDLFLTLTGIPLVREGFVFHMADLNIEVARECSGIRSSLSLIITGVLAGYYFLHTHWARVLLLLTLVPIAIVKNGIRITTLTVLGTYWDPRILDSDLHRKGGILFFLVALLIMGGVIMLLRRIESRHRPAVTKGNADDAVTRTGVPQ